MQGILSVQEEQAERPSGDLRYVGARVQNGDGGQLYAAHRSKPEHSLDLQMRHQIFHHREVQSPVHDGHCGWVYARKILLDYRDSLDQSNEGIHGLGYPTVCQ